MIATILAMIVGIHPAVQQRLANPLEGLGFMVGKWTGEGAGIPDASAGEFSFEWNLKQNILIRKSFAEYAAPKDRPASRHDDLMVIFVEGDRLKADYFDSEAHTIHYAVTVAPDGNSIEFLS